MVKLDPYKHHKLSKRTIVYNVQQQHIYLNLPIFEPSNKHSILLLFIMKTADSILIKFDMRKSLLHRLETTFLAPVASLWSKLKIIFYCDKKDAMIFCNVQDFSMPLLLKRIVYYACTLTSDKYNQYCYRKYI